MWIDKTLNNILSEAEEEFKDVGVSREQIKEIFYLYWRAVADFMKCGLFPRVYIPKFGYFSPKAGFIKAKIKNLEEVGETDEETLKTLKESEERIRLETKKRKRK